MFNKDINNLTLTSEIANSVFENIYAENNFGSDVSFLATLRALLAPRMKNEDRIALRVIIRSFRKSEIDSHSDAGLTSDILDIHAPHTLSVCSINSYRSGEEIIDPAFEKINKYLQKNDYTQLEDLRMFVSKQANMLFFVNENIKSTIVFVDSMNTRLYHLIESLTSRLIPWYFKDNPLNDEEKALLKSLTNKYAPEYEEIIEKFASKYDFRTKKIEKLLSGFEAQSYRNQLAGVTTSLSRTERQITENINTYRSLLDQRESLITQKFGLEERIRLGVHESEIIDYFQCNKYLEPIGTYGGVLEFVVSCYLQNFDPEMYERFSNNPDSYLYILYDSSPEIFRSKENIKEFLDAIFGEEPTLKIKMCAYYKMDISGIVSSDYDYVYPLSYKDRIPNPHLSQHNCLGDNRYHAEECLRNGNIITAIEQCVASAGSVNIGESATFPYFLEDLLRSNYKIIELPDGTSCSPKDAFDWLQNSKNPISTEETE